MSPPLSPSLSFLHRLYTCHLIYFGNLGHSKLCWPSLSTLLLLGGEILMVYYTMEQFYLIMISMKITSVEDHNAGNKVAEVFGNLKPVSGVVFNVTNILFYTGRLYFHVLLSFKGKQIMNEANHPLYRSIDRQQPALRRDLILLSELLTVVFFLLQAMIMIPFLGDRAFTPFGYVFLLYTYLSSRHQFWLNLVQLYVLEVSHKQLDRLQKLSRSENHPKKLLLYANLVEQLSAQLVKFYESFDLLVLMDYVFFLAIGLFSGLHSLIGIDDKRGTFMVLAGFVFLLFVYLFVHWKSHRLTNRFHDLRATLSRLIICLPLATSRSRRQQTNLGVRILLLGSFVGQGAACIRPPVVRMFHQSIADLVAALLFIINFAIVLYQTEYM